MRLASRLDAVVSRLDTQAKMQTVNKSMAGIVKALDKSLASNNLEQVDPTSTVLQWEFVQSHFGHHLLHGLEARRELPSRTHMFV